MCNCRASLEEELDMLRVQAAMDRATVKELHLCLANEHQGEHLFFFILRKCFGDVYSAVKKFPLLIFYLFICQTYIFQIIK